MTKLNFDLYANNGGKAGQDAMKASSSAFKLKSGKVVDFMKAIGGATLGAGEAARIGKVLPSIHNKKFIDTAKFHKYPKG